MDWQLSQPPRAGCAPGAARGGPHGHAQGVLRAAAGGHDHAFWPGRALQASRRRVIWGLLHCRPGRSADVTGQEVVPLLSCECEGPQMGAGPAWSAAAHSQRAGSPGTVHEVGIAEWMPQHRPGSGCTCCNPLSHSADCAQAGRSWLKHAPHGRCMSSARESVSRITQCRGLGYMVKSLSSK